MEQTILSKNNVGKHEFVEITIPAGATQQRFQFPDIQNIRNTKLKGVQVYDKNEISKSILTDNAIIGSTVQTDCYITLLTYDGREVIKQMPIRNLNNQGGFGVANLTNLGFAQIKNLRINWPKSFIEFVNPPSDPNNDLAVCFSIYYEDLTNAEMQQPDTFKNRS